MKTFKASLEESVNILVALYFFLYLKRYPSPFFYHPLIPKSLSRISLFFSLFSCLIKKKKFVFLFC